MNQFRFFSLFVLIFFTLGVTSCETGPPQNNSSPVSENEEVIKQVINPDIAAQQFCDCSTLGVSQKINCYNNWLDVYRNNNTSIAQAKQMTLKMTKCNPQDALDIVEKLMIRGYFIEDSIAPLVSDSVLTLNDASVDFCNCIVLTVVEKESCLNNWVMKYREASGSQMEGFNLQKQMQNCSEEDAKITWKKLLEK